jgi:hypothetical protein
MSNLNQNLNDNLSLEPQFQREKLFTIDKDTGERKFFAYAIYCFLLVQQSCFKNFKVFYKVDQSICIFLNKSYKTTNVVVLHCSSCQEGLHAYD